MNLEKSTARIAKRIKKGFQGYPLISLAYFGESADYATEVVITYIAEEDAPAQEQKLTSNGDARADITIQTTLLKIIERADAKTVAEVDGTARISQD